jgi:hypothetical protein
VGWKNEKRGSTGSARPKRTLRVPAERPQAGPSLCDSFTTPRLPFADRARRCAERAAVSPVRMTEQHRPGTLVNAQEDTYWGRVRRFAALIDMRKMFITQTQVREAQGVAARYAAERSLPATQKTVSEEQYTAARDTCDAVLHPDTGKRIPLVLYVRRGDVAVACACGSQRAPNRLIDPSRLRADAPRQSSRPTCASTPS